MSATLPARIAEEFAAANALRASRARAQGEAGEAGRSGSLDAQRQHALQTLLEHGLPGSRDENWKYVNLRPLEKVRFVPPSDRDPKLIGVAELPDEVASYARYVFVDGAYAPALSSQGSHPGVRVESMGPGASAASSILMPDLRFALLNDAFATDGAAIRVAAGTDCPRCVELLFVATTDSKSGASYPRVEVVVENGARVGLIERHVSVGTDANFANVAVRVQIAAHAQVRHYRVQQAGARAIWLDTLTATVAEGAAYQLYALNLGALSARSTVHVQLLGERSEVGIFSVAVGGRNQVHDTFAMVEHIAPNARTEQSFRGISSGRARVAFNGKIVVRKDARGTDSRQSLRGLLAGADAEIDVRPQLEIYTDEVRCSHGATAGKLDDNMLFYLLSRGLDRETAQRLLKWAFLEDVVAKIEVPELRRQIELSLAGQLNETAAIKELL